MRFASFTAEKPAPARAAVTTPTMFVVTQVRQALQHTAAIGAFSPYFAAVCASRPEAITFT